MVKILRKIKPKNAVVIAAWPGMGHVAIKAAHYLKDKLRARPFASLEAKKFFYQNDIAIDKSLIDIQKLPEGIFYYWQNKSGKHDVIIFISDQQPPVEKGVAYAKAILDFVKSLDVSVVFTFAALVSSIDFVKTPKTWYAVTHKEISKFFVGSEAKPLEYGQVSGLNGLFLGLAKKKKIKGACILGEIPFYSSQIDNPRSSLVVLSALINSLDIHIDLTELSVAAKILEEEIEKLLMHVKKPATDDPYYPISAEDIEKIKSILDSRSQIPNSAKEHIEKLFGIAQNDISHAGELKKTLDEWNVYKDYEDRFLALFKKDDENKDVNG